MKQIVFAVLLAVSLAAMAIMWGRGITTECDRLLTKLSDGTNSDDFADDWSDFSSQAALVTPYDLIRTGDSNCESYVALMESGADPADIEAARHALASSIREIRRIHSLSLELIL